MDERARAFWDAYWVEQTPTASARTMTRVLDWTKLERLRSLLPTQGRTLEVGCGSGRLSCYLARSGFQTISVDFSVAALREARANYVLAAVSGGFVSGEAAALPFSGECFDAVLSTGLLEHFEDPAPVVREMVRVLRAGGVFYSDIVPRKFSLFRSLDWLGRLKRRHLAPDAELGGLYERRFTLPGVTRLLETAGLDSVIVFPAGVVPPYLPLVYRVRWLRDRQVRLVERTRGLWARLDGTRLAEWLGFYYFASARKPAVECGLRGRQPPASS